MITNEVRKWIEKVERRQYTYEDALYELSQICNYLTKEELIQLKNQLKTFT